MTWSEDERAVVRVHTPDGTLRVAPSSACKGPFPRTDGFAMYVVTAHNPRGTVQPPEANQMAHRRLIAEAASRTGNTLYDAEGGDVDGNYVEQSIAFVADSDEVALSLGRLFQQKAVFKWTPNAWTVLACRGKKRSSFGYISSWDRRTVELQSAAQTLGLDRPLVDLNTLDRVLQTTLGLHTAPDPEYVHTAYDLVKNHVLEWHRKQKLQHAVARELHEETSSAMKRAKAQEKKEQQRRCRLEATRRRKEMRESGWPREWSVKQVEAWERLGGTLDLAQASRHAGWPVERVLAAAKEVESAQALHLPPGDAPFHQALGDDLLGLVRHDWPAAPPSTVLSVKRTLLSGRKGRCVVVGDESEVQVLSWARDPDQEWGAPAELGSYDDLHTAVTRLKPLRRVDQHELTVFATSDSSLGPHELAQVLEVATDVLRAGKGAVGDREPPSATEDADYAQYVDGLIEGVLADLEWIRTACYVNDLRLVPVRLRGEWFNLLFDEEAEQVSTCAELARYQWFSESGGAPISWEGGASIEAASSGVLCMRKWGDLDTATELMPRPATEVELVDVLAAWLVGDLDASTEAALALEPLDPGLTLDDEAREKWHDRLTKLTVDLWLDVEESTLQLLRQRLTAEGSPYRSEAYADVATALSEPLGHHGQELAAALDNAIEGGVIRDVLHGNWKSGSR